MGRLRLGESKSLICLHILGSSTWDLNGGLSDARVCDLNHCPFSNAFYPVSLDAHGNLYRVDLLLFPFYR